MSGSSTTSCARLRWTWRAGARRCSRPIRVLRQFDTAEDDGRPIPASRLRTEPQRQPKRIYAKCLREGGSTGEIMRRPRRSARLAHRRVQSQDVAASNGAQAARPEQPERRTCRHPKANSCSIYPSAHSGHRARHGRQGSDNRARANCGNQRLGTVFASDPQGRQLSRSASMAEHYSVLVRHPTVAPSE